MTNTNGTDQSTVTVPPQTPPPQSVVDTNTGFIVGADPAQRPTTAVPPQPSTAPTAEQIAAAVGQQVAPTINQQGQTLTQMQQRMEAMQAEIDIARQEREAATAAAQQAEEARLAAERAAEEEKLSAVELVNKVRQETQQQFDQLQATAAANAAILDQERHYNALQEYKARRLAEPEIAQAVMPHLHQYIVGNSEQEIEAAIARAAETSNQIVGEFQQYQQSYRQQAVGVSTATPAVGPMEAQPVQTEMTAQQINALSPAEYARLRPQLLKAAGDSFRANQGR